MTIILQKYKNLINNLMKEYFSDKIDEIIDSFHNFDINNYINLISSFDTNMCEFIKSSLVNLIEQLDQSYLDSHERKRKYHIKSHSKRTILTIFGEITYTRTFYQSKLNHKSFCYIDRRLGLKKYDYFDPYIKAEVLDFVSDHNYSKTAEHLNSLIGNRICLDQKEQYLSRQTVRNIILKERTSKPKIQKLPNVEELYIISDEKWIPTQNNNRKKVMQKSIVIFDGFTTIGKRKSLNHKMTFSGRNEDFIYEAIDYIEHAYDVSKIKRFYMLGDGASWIKGLKYYFNYNQEIEIIQGLDKFHLKQTLFRIFPNEDVMNALLEYIIHQNKDEFDRLTNEIIDLYPDRCDRIKEYKKYIFNNWNNIINLYKYDLSCPMESQISHTFASYFTSRPKAYSINTINLLIQLRLLKKNKYNIKKLFLNNINSDQILDLNHHQLNYSLFDRNTTYSIYSVYKRDFFRLN